ncbi:MAG TPA: hypothetical protein VIU45_05940 [Chitinophagaceae bacterium]
MITIEKKPGNEPAPRNAVEPYTIYLGDDPYVLTEEALKEQVDPLIQRRRNWHYPKLEFTGVQDARLTLMNTSRNVSHELNIRIAPDKLHVSCDCGLPAETLCVHAYNALLQIIWFGGTHYFKQYRPRGRAEMAAAHGQYFEKKTGDAGIKIIPKKELGSIYYLTGKLEGAVITEILKLPGVAPAPCQPASRTALTYILVKGLYQAGCPPFLLPCLGKLNTAGTYAMGFHHFVSGTEKEYDPYLTEEQRTLNGICYEMAKQAEKLPESIEECMITPAGPGSLAILFQLWKKAIPLLQQQEFLYKYYLSRKRELRGKPRKRGAWKIKISHNKPGLRFRLTDKGPFYLLEIEVWLEGARLNGYEFTTGFFIEKFQDMYLFSSLRDAAVAEWMEKHGGRITIFKEHFSAFEQDFLQPLREYYPVKGY